MEFEENRQEKLVEIVDNHNGWAVEAPVIAGKDGGRMVKIVGQSPVKDKQKGQQSLEKLRKDLDDNDFELEVEPEIFDEDKIFASKIRVYIEYKEETPPPSESIDNSTTSNT